jgi:hypothetical protein
MKPGELYKILKRIPVRRFTDGLSGDLIPGIFVLCTDVNPWKTKEILDINFLYNNVVYVYNTSHLKIDIGYCFEKVETSLSEI